VKITQVEPLPIRGARNYEVWVLVQVRTDTGIDGLGECFSWAWDDTPRARRIARLVGEIGAQLAGRDAFAVETFAAEWQPRGSGYEWHAAVSGIEIALWDVLGQSAGLAIHEILGGAQRAAIPLYANHGAFIGVDDQSERIARAVRCRDAGFHLFKWDPFQFRPGYDAPDIDAAVAEVAEFRAALGETFPLAIDGHGRFDRAGGIAAARAMERFGLSFFEEPTPPERPEWLADIAAAAPGTPLAAGECVTTESELNTLLDVGAISVLQPEPGANGGIWPTLLAAVNALGRGVQVAPHNWCGPVLTRATAHVAAAMANLFLMEYAASASVDEDEPELLDPPLRPEGGFLPVPAGPGLGARLDPQALARRRLD